MGYKIGTFATNSTGLQTFNFGTTSTPTALTLVVQNKLGVNEGTLKHVSIGTATISGQRVTSYLKDGTGTAYPFDSTTQVISHYELSGGVPVEVMAATFDSFTSTGFKLNFIAASNAYSIYARVDY